jgi:SpoVK/Ycf46/Vps4 family AAA+-type ATPase
LKGSAGRTLVNQFLSEMDGFAKNNAGVFILGATNHPWDLDTAIRRPGRFDRLVLVTPPSLAARKRLFELSLKGRPLGTIDYDRAAKQTDGYSGADIAAIATVAVQLAMEQAMESGKDVPIDDGMLKRAIADVRASTRPWLETARNYAIYANEGGVYDDLLGYLKKVGLG